MHVKPTVWLMAVLMSGAAIAGISIRTPVPEQPNFLEATVPETFGEWRKLDASPQMIDPATAEILKKVYAEVLSRTYVNSAGEQIMVSIARSKDQIGIHQAHLPKVCYPAQGFELLGAPNEDETLSTPDGQIPVTRMTARMGSRTEAVTYWLTMSDRVVRTRLEKRIVQLIAALTGQSPGGLMFRVSSIDRNSGHAFAEQQQFVADLMASISPDGRRRLAGLTPSRS